MVDKLTLREIGEQGNDKKKGKDGPGIETH